MLPHMVLVCSQASPIQLILNAFLSGTAEGGNILHVRTIQSHWIRLLLIV
jgi:hypothetical protein